MLVCKLVGVEAPPPADDASAVDEIAARMESLGDEIDARVRAALGKKGLGPKGS
jgi:uncharacterized small protein (DUF1192 family)